MALAAGIASALGFATEGVSGTYTAPDHFIEYLSESVGQTIKRIDSKALRNGRRVTARWAPSTIEVGGDLNFELPNRVLPFLFKHGLGTVTASVTTTGRNYADGATTAASTTVTSPALAAYATNDVNMAISGPGIPPGSYIVSRTSATQITISQAATATTSGQTHGLAAGYLITPGDLAGTTFTTQIAIPDITGTKRIFSYIGNKVD